jgi:hypothetical protein
VGDQGQGRALSPAGGRAGRVTSRRPP